MAASGKDLEANPLSCRQLLLVPWPERTCSGDILVHCQDRGHLVLQFPVCPRCCPAGEDAHSGDRQADVEDDYEVFDKAAINRSVVSESSGNCPGISRLSPGRLKEQRAECRRLGMRSFFLLSGRKSHRSDIVRPANA